MDSVTIGQRSRNMSRIKSRDSVPEKAVRSYLHKMGLRFRIDVGALPGRPDLVFRKHRCCVFVHGCFWHQHPGCKRGGKPKSNQDYWSVKLARNVSRDALVCQQLEEQHWHVIIIWECQTSNMETLEMLYHAILGSATG